MVALLRIYEEEDEAYQDLVTVATTFFQYLLQPFRDMREIAGLYKLEILVQKYLLHVQLKKMTKISYQAVIILHKYWFLKMRSLFI